MLGYLMTEKGLVFEHVFSNIDFEVVRSGTIQNIKLYFSVRKRGNVTYSYTADIFVMYMLSNYSTS